MNKYSIEELKSAIIRNIDAQHLDSLAYLLGRWSEVQGFKCNYDIIPEKLMLVVTELAEAMEAYRHKDADNFAEELADTFIRLLDMCGRLQISIQDAVRNKMEKNFARPYKHGKEM